MHLRGKGDTLKKYNRATGINQKSPRKAGIFGDPVNDTHIFKSQLHPSVRQFTFIYKPMTSLCVSGIFQLERLAVFMFTSGQPASVASRFISVDSELIGVLFSNNEKYL